MAGRRRFVQQFITAMMTSLGVLVIIFRWCPSRVQPPPAQCESVTGRRVVRVVLLNGCSVDFTVEVCTLLYSVSAVW